MIHYYAGRYIKPDGTKNPLYLSSVQKFDAGAVIPAPCGDGKIMIDFEFTGKPV